MKIKRLKSLFSDSLIYGLSGIVSSFISIFLFPLYTRVFTPAEYGIIALLTTTYAVVYILLIMNLDNSMAAWHWTKPEPQERKRTLNSWFWFLGLAGLIAALIFWMFSDFWAVAILQAPHYSYLFPMFAIGLAFGGFQKVVNMWFRMERRPVATVSYSLCITLLTVGLNVLFVLVLKKGIYGIYLSQAIVSVTGFMLAVLLLFQHLSLRYFSKARLKEMLLFSLPLLPSSFMYWIMNSTSSYFLNIYSSKSEIGLYQIGSAIGSILNLGVWGFMQAWSPFALSISKDEDAGEVYAITLELYCIVGFFVVLLLALFAHEILIIFTNENYLGAKHVIAILSLNVLVIGIPQILSIANALSHSTKSYAYAVIIGSVITIIIFNFLIPVFGKEGAAFSVLIGNCAAVIIHARLVQKIYPIPYHFKRIGLASIIILVFFVIAFFFNSRTDFSWQWMLFYKFIIAILAVVSISIFYRKLLFAKFARFTLKNI